MNQQSKPPCRIQCGNDPDAECSVCEWRNESKPFMDRSNSSACLVAMFQGSPSESSYYEGEEQIDRLGVLAHHLVVAGGKSWVRFRRA